MQDFFVAAKNDAPVQFISLLLFQPQIWNRE